MRCLMPTRQRVFRSVYATAIVVFVGLVWAEITFSEIAAHDLSSSSGRHVLWKVQSQQNTVYLAGSIHVLQEQHYPLPQVFDAAFHESSHVMFEVNLKELSSPTLQMTMVQKGLYLNGESLENVLSSSGFATAKRSMAALGRRLEDFNQMKPWMAATSVMALELQELGFESAHGVDRYYFEKAQAAGKSIKSLETVEFQLDLFDRLPGGVQEQFLLQTLTELKDLDQEVRELVRAWQQGDVTMLERLLGSMRDYPELYQSLVVDRNVNWLPHVEAALEAPAPVFVVVGALHLLGTDGLVEVLKSKGYLVQQL